MELNNTDLFSYNGLIRVLEDSTEELERTTVAYTLNEKDKPYIIQKEDSLEKIAYQFYKTLSPTPERFWFYIADVNAEKINNPLDLSDLLGQTIIIPDLLRLGL